MQAIYLIEKRNVKIRDSTITNSQPKLKMSYTDNLKDNYYLPISVCFQTDLFSSQEQPDPSFLTYMSRLQARSSDVQETPEKSDSSGTFLDPKFPDLYDKGRSLRTKASVDGPFFRAVRRIQEATKVCILHGHLSFPNVQIITEMYWKSKLI